MGGRAVAPFAEWVTRALWSSSARLARESAPATRLTQRFKREAKCMPSLPPTIKAPPRDNPCRGCGKMIQDGRENCASCAVSDATKNMLAARIGRQMANGPEAQVKRADTQRKNALAQHAWKSTDQPAWLTDMFYSENIQPLLTSMSASTIARTISVSRWYAGRIREGYRHIPDIGRRWQGWPGCQQTVDGWDRTRTRLRLGGGFPLLTLSVARWVHNSAMATFSEAPL